MLAEFAANFVGAFNGRSCAAVGTAVFRDSRGLARSLQNPRHAAEWFGRQVQGMRK
jgi:hypothetical protein